MRTPHLNPHNEAHLWLEEWVPTQHWFGLMLLWLLVQSVQCLSVRFWSDRNLNAQLVYKGSHRSLLSFSLENVMYLKVYLRRSIPSSQQKLAGLITSVEWKINECKGNFQATSKWSHFGHSSIHSQLVNDWETTWILHSLVSCLAVGLQTSSSSIL